MKKSRLTLVFWPFFLLGCSTPNAMLDREPILTLEASFSKNDFRDCVFRWSDKTQFSWSNNFQLRLKYLPDGVWIRDAAGGAVALITQINGTINLYHHWNAAPMENHLIFLTETCNRDATLRPPSNFWKVTPRLRDE